MGHLSKHLKVVLLLILFSIIKLHGKDLSSLKIYGNTEYVKQKEQSLITTINFEYKIILHEPRHRKYALVLGGIISPDYDHLGNEIKVNVFTTFGVDF